MRRPLSSSRMIRNWTMAAVGRIFRVQSMAGAATFMSHLIFIGRRLLHAIPP
jgi:hypothetical protein